MPSAIAASDAPATIHDTLSGERLEPTESGNSVSVYLCGVTVYDDAHIGHARTIIVFDVLRRHLENNGFAVRMIQNFTDVDDKIIARARTEGVPASKLSDRYISRYYAEFDRLNVLRADAYPRATEHITDIVSFIEELIKSGAAYVAENGVYFAVSGFGPYGRLSKKRTDELRSGARIEIDETKRDPLDFALWKFGSDDPSWESPWGAGRPGWHVECSAMSLKYLGDGIDIHGGGRDLIFPHHENEIAQSESCTGSRFARIWMHVGMVTIGGEKMSKSLGNIRSVRQALEDWGPNVIRLFCLSVHYSKPTDYSEENLQESLVRWRQLEACRYEIRHAIAGGRKAAVTTTEPDVADNGLAEARAGFDAALNDDLNTRTALSALMEIVSETNDRVANNMLDAQWATKAEAEMTRMSGVLGLSFAAAGEDETAKIDAAVAERNSLRENRQYEKADEIRDELAAQNIEILDRGDETVWIKREKIRRDAR